MAGKKIITVVALLLTLSLQLFPEDKPKKSKFHAVTHWVATHKMAIAISAGTAAATGFMVHNYPGPNRMIPVPADSYRIKCACGSNPVPPAP